VRKKTSNDYIKNKDSTNEEDEMGSTSSPDCLRRNHLAETKRNMWATRQTDNHDYTSIRLFVIILPTADFLLYL
jgi:hypothetical protein